MLHPRYAPALSSNAFRSRDNSNAGVRRTGHTSDCRADENVHEIHSLYYVHKNKILSYASYPTVQ